MNELSYLGLAVETGHALLLLDVVSVNEIHVRLVDCRNSEQIGKIFIQDRDDRRSRHLVIMILGFSLLLLLELVSSCFSVVPMFVLVGVMLARLDEIPEKTRSECL